MLIKWNTEELVITVAGLPAERRINPESKLTSEEQSVVDTFFVGKSPAEREDMFREATERAETIVDANWRSIERVADALLKHRRLTGEEVSKLIAGGDSCADA